MKNIGSIRRQRLASKGPLCPGHHLAQGGGAIRSIGEKFAANPVTGTGSMSVPIATSPGRSGFGLQLSLSYDSGAGKNLLVEVRPQNWTPNRLLVAEQFRQKPAGGNYGKVNRTSTQAYFTQNR